MAQIFPSVGSPGWHYQERISREITQIGNLKMVCLENCLVTAAPTPFKSAQMGSYTIRMGQRVTALFK